LPLPIIHGGLVSSAHVYVLRPGQCMQGVFALRIMRNLLAFRGALTLI
jgi:hypothetical protein